MRRWVWAGLAWAVAGCSAEEAAPVADGGLEIHEPGLPGDQVAIAVCGLAGAWRIDWTLAGEWASAGAGRFSDVLHLAADAVWLDTPSTCDAPPTLETRWDTDTCTLQLEWREGPCGPGEWRGVLTATIPFDGGPADGQWRRWPGDDPEPDPVAFTGTVRRLEPAGVCAAPEVAPAPWPAVRADLGMDLTVSYAGPVEARGVTADPDGQGWLSLGAVGGGPLTPDSATVAVPWAGEAPPDGDGLWLDVEATDGWWQQTAYVLRAGADGPLVQAGLTGFDWLDAGPLARAGLRFTPRASCASAWLPIDCLALTTHQRLALDGTDLALGAGEVGTVSLPALGALQIDVRQAVQIEHVQCTDQWSHWENLQITPAPVTL